MSQGHAVDGVMHRHVTVVPSIDEYNIKRVGWVFGGVGSNGIEAVPFN
jgi:hypothetical protein